MIKAIDTKYGKYIFRSRLEARFAVYFDELGVEWLYEHEGFDLGGERYLPDFYFPKYKLYAEIKPVAFTDKEHSKCKRLCLMANCMVIELVGLPNMDMSTVLIPYQYMMCPIHGQIQAWFSEPMSNKCKCGVRHKVFSSMQETKGTLVLKNKKDSYCPIYYGEYTDEVLENAIIKSTQARFEFKDKK